MISDLFLPFIIVSLPLQMVQIMYSYALVIMKLPSDLLAKFEPYLSRAIEYRADKFAADLTGAKGMLSFLECMKGEEHYMEFGFLNMKTRPHPPAEFRIEKLHAHPSYEKPTPVVKENVNNVTYIKKTYNRKKVQRLYDNKWADDFSSFT